ncbi:hypothetical protein [Paenibacillus sp. FSL R7-0333]|uniref:hypothetical protein n=1 Tax=Paenibacillus sp. FSL R7-0333 TaxID=1926587 RepID=UPI00096E39A9|nr:hypothetical protein BK146_32315 [Paenibacillus sp. FSL R7-0333]
MSLWHAYFQGNQVFVCADSRVSARVMEKSYYVTDKYKKIRVIGNKVIFVSGNVEVDQQLFNLIKADSSIRFIQRKVKKLYNEYNKKNQFNDCFDFAINIVTMEYGKATLYQLNHFDNFSMNRQVPSDCQLFNAGAHSEEARQHCQNIKLKNPTLDIPEVIRQAYEQVADETVGGALHCFLVSSTGIQKGISAIADNRQLAKWKGANFPYECDDWDYI